MAHLKDHGLTAPLAEAVRALRARRGSLDFDLDEALAQLDAPAVSRAALGSAAQPTRVSLRQVVGPGPLVVRPATHGGGCPGSRAVDFGESAPLGGDRPAISSALGHWPIQLHLVNPMAPSFRDAHLLVAADCVAFAVGDFHARHLHGKSLVIACPKLDARQEIYGEKLQ